MWLSSVSFLPASGPRPEEWLWAWCASTQRHQTSWRGATAGQTRARFGAINSLFLPRITKDFLVVVLDSAS